MYTRRVTLDGGENSPRGYDISACARHDGRKSRGYHFGALVRPAPPSCRAIKRARRYRPRENADGERTEKDIHAEDEGVRKKKEKKYVKETKKKKKERAETARAKWHSESDWNRMIGAGGGQGGRKETTGAEYEIKRRKHEGGNRNEPASSPIQRNTRSFPIRRHIYRLGLCNISARKFVYSVFVAFDCHDFHKKKIKSLKVSRAAYRIYSHD